MNTNYYVEISAYQKNHFGEHICGDVFVSERLKEEKRAIAVLADGMGHGVKANVLATLTATMSLSFAKEHEDANTIANIIMRTLPVCSERQTSYSTFSIVDVDNEEVTILEYDNPLCLIIRDGEEFDPKWETIILEDIDSLGRSTEIKLCTFKPQKEDRIIIVSDGITQSGMGMGEYLLGWGRENYVEYVKETISHEKNISASKLAQRVVNKANINDHYRSKDDTSCGVFYFRDPRKMIIATGPPFHRESDKEYAQRLWNFKGPKVICGATTADIISRELNIEVDDSILATDPSLPQMSKMDGIDLVTEGILTLTKVINMLSSNTESSLKLGNGPADMIIKLLLESDEIVIMVGTMINQAHHDPTLPVEIEIRRSTIKRLSELLEKKFMKEVIVEYI